MTPPDRNRCQAVIVTTEYNAFQLGGRPESKVERCTNRPTMIVEEAEPGTDGQRGSMSLCDNHAAVFTDTVKGAFIFTEICDE